MFKMGTRLGYFLINSLLYLVIYHLMGFEVTVILGIGTILGELSYQEKNKPEKDNVTED